MDLYHDQVFCFTHGDLIALPKRATAVDLPMLFIQK